MRMIYIHKYIGYEDLGHQKIQQPHHFPDEHFRKEWYINIIHSLCQIAHKMQQ